MTGLTTGTGLYGCLFCVYLATSCRPFLSVCWCCYVVFFFVPPFLLSLPVVPRLSVLCSFSYVVCFSLLIHLFVFHFWVPFGGLRLKRDRPMQLSPGKKRRRRDFPGAAPFDRGIVSEKKTKKKTETILGVIFGLCKLINGKNIHIRYANPPPSPPPLDSEPSKDKRHFASAVRAIHGR